MPALVRVTATLLDPPGTVLVTVMVQTVVEVWAIEMLEMLALKLKSWPFTVLRVEQSIPTDDAVIVKVLVLVEPVAEEAAIVAVGAVAETGIIAVTFSSVVAGSPDAKLPYSITFPVLL